MPFFRSHAIVLRGWALVEQGQCEEGIAQLREGLVAYRATGAELECSHWLALLAEAYRDTGQPEEGLRLIAEALDHVAQTGIVYYEAELHRLDGELRLRLDTPDEQRAEASFRRALETAGRQQAKSWELRAATSLARLWGEQGRQTEARELLAPVYGWFTEGFDTARSERGKGAARRACRREPSNGLLTSWMSEESDPRLYHAHVARNRQTESRSMSTTPVMV